MEVIPINTNDNATSKADLWADRIHAFQESGLSRKEWCQQNGIPQSTLGYWIRKLQSEAAETESASDPVFAKLPSEHELHFSTAGTGKPPVMLCLPENIRIERPEKAPSLLKGSVATPSLVAGIMNAKYVGGMPLARQEREFARYDLNLSTKTMANWIIQCADRYLQPLYELMKEEFLRSRYAHGDETRVQVIDEPEQKGSAQNWMWVYLTDEYSGSPRMVLFQYERTRAGYHPVEFLGDQFQGYFTCDGYQAYHSLPERIAVTGCMAHARRRFDESLTVLKKDFTKEQLKETTAYQAMARIGMFYKIEEMIRDKSPEERYEERQKQAKPLLEAFFEWLHTLEDAVDRSSKIGEAVLYTLNQETYLKRYLEDGHLSIDNLAAERALKNFAIGRRNWLFAKSIRGAQASATVYSITETALLNGLKPYNYLTYVMEKMKDLGAFPAKEEMLELLPWSSNLPDDCRSKLKK